MEMIAVEISFQSWRNKMVETFFMRTVFFIILGVYIIRVSIEVGARGLSGLIAF